MFAEVRFLMPLVVNGKHREIGEVARVDYLLATALIEQGYALPVGAEPVPELRPVRGRFH